MEYKLELVAVPVSDVDHAKAFYEQAGFNADHDHTISDEIRFVQLTPPGSACSIAIGNGLTTAAPGSIDGLQMVVADADAARSSSSGVASMSPMYRSFRGAGSSSSVIPTATSGRCSSCHHGAEHHRQNG